MIEEYTSEDCCYGCRQNVPCAERSNLKAQSRESVVMTAKKVRVKGYWKEVRAGPGTWLSVWVKAHYRREVTFYVHIPGRRRKKNVSFTAKKWNDRKVR